MSSTSKGEKTIANFYKNLNKELMEKLSFESEKKKGRIFESDLSLRIREIIGFGLQSEVFG